MNIFYQLDPKSFSQRAAKNNQRRFTIKIITSITIIALLVGTFSLLTKGEFVGSEFCVNTYTASSQSFPSIAMNSTGNFVIAWESDEQDGDEDGIYAQRYASDGTPLGSEFRVNTYTTDYQWKPSIAMDSAGNFIIAWQSWFQDGDGYGIYTQRYASNGTPLGGEFRVNTYTTSVQWEPSIAMDSTGNFIIAWESYEQDGNGFGIFAQRYMSDGTPLGSEFRVNTYTTDDQRFPSTAMDFAGNFVIAWESTEQDGGGNDIRAQRYASDGNLLGSEFRVNTYTTDNQRFPSTAVDSTGNFIIAWESFWQDGNLSGIYAQRYANDGTALGSEFRVNTYITNSQSAPSIAMNSTGDFVIAWVSDGQDGDGYGIYAQRYASDGNLLGSEFRVNTYTTSWQDVPSIAMDSNGNLVIAWESYGQDGDGWGIYAQMFDSVPIPEFSNLLIPIVGVSAFLLLLMRKKKTLNKIK